MLSLGKGHTKLSRPFQFAIVLPALALSAAMAAAQGHGGHGGPGGGAPGGAGPHGASSIQRIGPANSFVPRNNLPTRPATSPAAPHMTVQVGPPGRWWDDKSFARNIGIADDQRKRMDAIFNENKKSVIDSYNRLQREENALNKLVKAKHPNEEKIMAQIDQAAQARVDLEKNTTRLMLALRRELTDDQLAKLEAHSQEMQPADSAQPSGLDQ